MQLEFMEDLLRIEAEVKHFFGGTDRSYEQTLMDELLKIIEEAELLFGPRIVHMNCFRLELASAVVDTPTSTLSGR
jgi:hypothetical protein